MAKRRRRISNNNSDVYIWAGIVVLGYVLFMVMS